MKIKSLTPLQRSHRYSNTINIRTSRSPYSLYNLSNDNSFSKWENKSNNFSTISRIPFNNYKNNKYITTRELKKEKKKEQLNKSYDYNFYENNNIYKAIAYYGKNGQIQLGNTYTNFTSEYDSMLDFPKKIMLQKSKRLNKSVDLPKLKRKNYKKRQATKDIYIKNSTNINQNFEPSEKFLFFDSSNIFFDKEKERKNFELN